MEHWARLTLTDSGRPQLLDDEVEVAMIGNVALKNENNKTAFEGGRLTITNLRLLWICDQLTSQHHAIALQQIMDVEKKGGFVPGVVSSPKIQIHVCSLLDVKKPSPPTSVCYLSFRGGSRDEAMERLRSQLRAKDWEKRRDPKVENFAKKEEFTTKRAGIGGLLRSVEQSHAATEESLTVAFADLDALMKTAADMVALANKIATKTTKADEELAGIQRVVNTLGISSPVTREVAGAQFDNQLCRQLAEFLQSVLPQHKGILLLTDLYCLFNRARGVELISPDDLRRAAFSLNRLNVGLQARTFASGVVVVQSEEHSDEKASVRLMEFAKTKGSFNETDCVFSLGLPLVLAKEQIKTAEEQGKLCRDETENGVQFFPNKFLLDW